jgi:glycerol-1-phosphate dehydrogenase [NAD(P)+]
VLPRVPADLGLSAGQFAEAVVLAPSTRPDRYTILEHLDLDPGAVRDRVDAFVSAYGG